MTLTEQQDPYAVARAAADRLRAIARLQVFDLAVVLGSGWAPAADLLGDTADEFRVTELPGFSRSGVPGHAGRVRIIRNGHRRVLAFLGRSHLYEGRGVSSVVHAVRTAVAAGCRIVVLTNGAGGLRGSFTPGTPVLISDHVNLTGQSPLTGANFLDMTDLYSPRLRRLCRQFDPTLEEGVYVAFPGPQFETPAEVRMVKAIGGDLVGMSTALEAMAAREAGAEVLGISLVTNLAAGLSGKPLDHEEVLQTGRRAATRMGELLAEVVACEHPELPR